MWSVAKTNFIYENILVISLSLLESRKTNLTKPVFLPSYRIKEKVPQRLYLSRFEPNVFSFIGKWLSHLRFKLNFPEKFWI